MKKRITKKMIKEFLDRVAVKKLVPEYQHYDDETKKIKGYYSKFGESYLTNVGQEENVKFLLEFGITECLQAFSFPGRTTSIGFNPEEQKWYGWSHRAIYGFSIGSKCKKGDCHYRPANESDFLENCLRFWRDDENHLNIRGEFVHKDEEQGVEISWEYSDKVKNKKLHGKTGGDFYVFPDKCGRGEWEAKTLEDAKQMACDFARGVS